MPDMPSRLPSLLRLLRPLVLGLIVATGASGCATLRRWLVPPPTHSDNAAVSYSHLRTSENAELILVVASLPGGDTEDTAIAVRDGRIIARGTLATLDGVRGPATRTIRLPGGVATAGLVAGHVRLEPAAMAIDAVDLSDCKSIADVVNTLKSARQLVLTESGWLWANGLNAALFDKLSSADLDRAVGRTSVLVTPAGKPVGLANGGLMARLGDLGAEIATHAGRLDDRQVRLTWQQLPAARPERLKPLLLGLFADLQRQGITEVHAFGATQAGLEALYMLDRESRLTVRARVYLDAERPEGQALLHPKRPTVDADGQPTRQLPPVAAPKAKRVPLVETAGVSLELDGSVRAGSAALTEKYADLPHAGTLTYSDAALQERLTAADEASVHVAVRASGDAALAQLARVLAAMARGRDAPQLRVELPEIVSPETLDALHTAGALCVVAPVLTAKELEQAKRRLGPARLAWFDRAASLAAACPLQVALDFDHPEALRAHDRLTRHNSADPEAMATQQAWRALSSGGTARETPPIQVGEDADLVVWSRDPLLPGKIPPKVIASVIGGTVTLLIGREADRD